MLVRNQDRKHRQLATSHKSSCEASRRAECGKSACSVRRGGEWKPATVRLVRHSQRNGEQRIDRTYGYGAIPRPYQWEKRQFLALRFWRGRRKGPALKKLDWSIACWRDCLYVIGRPGSQNENSGLPTGRRYGSPAGSHV